MLKKLAPYILAVSLFILGLSVGFFLSRNVNNLNIQDIKKPAVTDTESAAGSGLYSSQNASIRGIITKKEGNTLTVKNLNTQTEGEVILSSRVIIAKAVTQPSAAASSGVNSLELNKEALISLEMSDGHYEAVTIQYVIPAPSLPPITSSASSSPLTP